jgi:hypothetical protein
VLSEFTTKSAQALESHLTAECLTIILFKKQMNARYWPRLYKAGGVLSYIGTDFKRWTWEGDQSDGIASISESTDGGELGMINGQRFVQVISLQIGLNATITDG